MTEVQIWQVVALTLLAGYAQYDGLHGLTSISKPVIIALLTGLIMGDMATGLFVGGTIQLMSLGVGNFGGASVPDYLSAAMLGTVFAITSGQGAEFGVSLAIPIGVLLVNMDILARFCNLFFQRRADKAFNDRKYDRIIFFNKLGAISWCLSRMIPVFIGLALGPEIVNTIVEVLPAVILNGMKTAGGLLPAIGLAILLRYMPLKFNVSYLIIGFVLAAYMKVDILGISLIGLAVAILIYQYADRAATTTSYATNPNSTMIEGDE